MLLVTFWDAVLATPQGSGAVSVIYARGIKARGLVALFASVIFRASARVNLADNHASSMHTTVLIVLFAWVYSAWVVWIRTSVLPFAQACARVHVTYNPTVAVGSAVVASLTWVCITS